MTLDKKIDDLAIIIVTYNPNMKELILNLDIFLTVTDNLIIVDNSDNNKLEKYLNQKNYKVDIFSLYNNIGIAGAQNMAVEYCMEKKLKYLLFFDQDSFLISEDIYNLYDDFKKYPEIGLMGPSLEKDKKNSYTETIETLSSGSLVELSIFDEVGLFKEELFIDLVDYEFCWRIKKKGKKIVINNKLHLNHKLGEGNKYKYLRVPAPIRNYYQFRNTIYLMTKKTTPVNFKIKYIALLPIKFLVYLTLLDNRKLRVNYMIMGIKDGLKGRLGKIN